MQDVSVRVGGIGQPFGPYQSTYSTEGDIQTNGASIVMVENYSPWVFQIAGYTIPPMTRRTFGVDQYPSLKWTITGGAINLSFSGAGGIGELRTVMIILDPPIVSSDGPVYPTPIPLAGSIDVSTAPNAQGTAYGIDARDLLTFVKWGTGIAWGQYAKDPAIVGFQIMVSSDLAPSEISGLADNLPVVAQAAFGFCQPTQFLRGRNLLSNPGPWAGTNWSAYWDMPGDSLIVLSLPGGITAGVIDFVAWVGYHL